MKKKWIKTYNGVLYNIDFIESISWKKSSSAAAPMTYELHIYTVTNKLDVIAGGCNRESDKEVIDDKIRNFLQTEEEAILQIPKLEG